MSEFLFANYARISNKAPQGRKIIAQDRVPDTRDLFAVAARGGVRARKPWEKHKTSVATLLPPAHAHLALREKRYKHESRPNSLLESSNEIIYRGLRCQRHVDIKAIIIEE